MKVLLFTETLQPGGAELFVVRLANRLSEDCEVGVVVFYERLVHSSLLEEFNSSVKVYLIKIPFVRIGQRLDGFLLKLGIDFSMVQKNIQEQSEAIINEFKPDVVHGHLFKTDWIISKVRRNHNFKHVTTIHGDYSAFYHGEGGSQLLHVKRKMQSVIGTIDSIVCLSEEHLQFFKHQYPWVESKLHKIYNGYEPSNRKYIEKERTALGLPASGFLFGMVSRGVEKKGWQKAIDAFLHAALPDSYLVLVGEGDYLKKLASGNKHSNIIFAGYSAQPLEFIQYVDVCLLPSLFKYESLPTVIIEYLYCGKPIIASDVGEIRKMITDHVSNKVAGDLLVLPDHEIDVEIFSSLMTRYYKETLYLLDKAQVARNAFSKFDMEKCKDAYLNIYQSDEKKENDDNHQES